MSSASIDRRAFLKTVALSATARLSKSTKSTAWN